LKASTDLKACLREIGSPEHFAAEEFLFQEDGNNAGVYFLAKGRVRMSVKSLPKLDRLFSAGSLLGLPSTFTERPYSLSAVALTEVDVIHVKTEAFLDLMRQRPDLCGEATKMLGQEVTFIQAALAERHKQASTRKVLGTHAVPA
jgi:CRP-like cAMP-binding protein